jgi:hypothetical protein
MDLPVLERLALRPTRELIPTKYYSSYYMCKELYDFICRAPNNSANYMLPIGNISHEIGR